MKCFLEYVQTKTGRTLTRSPTIIFNLDPTPGIFHVNTEELLCNLDLRNDTNRILEHVHSGRQRGLQSLNLMCIHVLYSKLIYIIIPCFFCKELSNYNDAIFPFFESFGIGPNHTNKCPCSINKVHTNLECQLQRQKN